MGDGGMCVENDFYSFKIIPPAPPPPPPPPAPKPPYMVDIFEYTGKRLNNDTNGPHTYSAITSPLSNLDNMLLLGWNEIVCLEAGGNAFILKEYYSYNTGDVYAKRDEALQRAKTEETSFSRAVTLGVYTCTTAVACRGNRIVFLHLDRGPTKEFSADVSGYLTNVKTFLADSAGGTYLMISYTLMEETVRNAVSTLISGFRGAFQQDLAVSILFRGNRYPILSHVAFGFSISGGAPRIYFDLIPGAFICGDDHSPSSVHAFFEDRKAFAAELGWDRGFFIFNRSITEINTDGFRDFCKKCFVSALNYGPKDIAVPQNPVPSSSLFTRVWDYLLWYCYQKTVFLDMPPSSGWAQFINKDPFKSYFENLWARNAVFTPAPPPPAPQSAAARSFAEPGKTPSIDEVRAAISSLKPEEDLP
ncbi:MAG: hypothetical protein LBD47_03720, partial [Treponema sp.]|nr:hypothetical protein [Treponema sp.]